MQRLSRFPCTVAFGAFGLVGWLAASAVAAETAASQADQGATGPSAEEGKRSRRAETSSESGQLAEVIVTAQKRTERLQDVPVPVTAINAADLVDSNELRLQDYYTKIPGLSIADGVIAIRGITAGPGGNPTVGITVDDMPYGSATNLGGGNAFPDIDPSELARIEVLRGPQGTLYGASSMGGLIKFVTVDPSTSGASGRIEGGANWVHNGAETGYNLRGAANVPLGDTVAFRVSGFTRIDPGYINNPGIGVNGVNEQHVSGGRLSALWAPSTDLSLKLSALYQDFKLDGLNLVTQASGLGDLQQIQGRGMGSSSGTLQAYSATIAGRLAGVSFTSISAYNYHHLVGSFDASSFFASLTEPLYSVGGVKFLDDNSTERYTQEVRLSSQVGKLEWLVGGFYSHERSPHIQEDDPVDLNTGKQVAIAYHSSFPQNYTESAGFATVTFHFTDRFDVQLGGRASSIRQSSQTTTTTTLQPVFNNNAGPVQHTESSPVTYLLTPELKLSPNFMTYVRLASGFRAGGSNDPVCTTYAFPCQYAPDKTRTYELGAKGTMLDNKVAIDGSLYYIDWKDIQLLVINQASFVGYTTNVSAAKSKGLELSVEAKPVKAITVTAAAAWSKAELTEGFPAGAAFGVSGERLPFSPRFSGNVSIEQTIPVGTLTAFWGGSLGYVGDRQGAFTGTLGVPAPRQDLPGYARTDLRIGVRADSWTVTAFANNVFDRRGLLDGGLDEFPSTEYLYIQPRTAGVNCTKSF